MSAINKILAVLPEEPVEAFHQINNYLRISSFFKNAKFVIFCTREVAPFFKQIHPEASITEYDRSVRYLFSPEFNAWGKEFNREEFDVCLMLERNPDISLRYLAGKTAAAVRVGYVGAGDFPFLNMHINPSPKRPYLSDQNALMAGIMGAADRIKVRWSVSKETMEEVSHLARERAIPVSSRLGCIDVGYFYRAFGADWTCKLCAAISSKNELAWCLLTEDEPDAGLAECIGSLRLPVFSSLSASRCAALLSRSECVVSGVSVVFELANLLRIAVIGVFEKSILSRYCRESDSTRGVGYTGKPDRTTIEAIVETAVKSGDRDARRRSATHVD